MIKSDRWIKDFGQKGGIIPFNIDQVNPASYDVTLGNHWIYQDRKLEKDEGNVEVFSSEFILFPQQTVLATTREYIKVPRDICVDLKLKSTIGRKFVNHLMAGYIDCNFHGQITLELHNVGIRPFNLIEGMHIAQLVFMQMSEPPEYAYGEGGKGRYQGQVGTTKAKDI